MARWPSCLAGLLALLACLGAAAAAGGTPVRFLVEYEQSSGDQVRPCPLSCPPLEQQPGQKQNVPARPQGL